MRHRMVGQVARLVVGASVVATMLWPSTPSAQESAAVVIDISAERFSFTPSQIRGKVGAPMTIRLRSDDTDHGFRILDTDVNVRIPKRGKGTATVTFRPGREGRYTFECSHVCGAGHAFMRGTIVVSK